MNIPSTGVTSIYVELYSYDKNSMQNLLATNIKAGRLPENSLPQSVLARSTLATRIRPALRPDHRQLRNSQRHRHEAVGTHETLRRTRARNRPLPPRYQLARQQTHGCVPRKSLRKKSARQSKSPGAFFRDELHALSCRSAPDPRAAPRCGEADCTCRYGRYERASRF